VKRISFAFLAGGLLVLLALPTPHGRAQEGPSDSDDGASGYPGVRPGTGSPPASRRARPSGRIRLITWPGFEAQPDGSSRFFVQLSGPVRYETSQSEGRFEVLLRGVRIHLRNNGRPLETRFFETPVLRARLARRGRDVAFVFELRGPATPSVHAEVGEGGYHFLYVDFPAGQGPAPSAPPAP